MCAESQAASAAAVQALAGSAQLLKAVTFKRCGAPGLARTAALARLAAEPAPNGADAEDRCLAYAQLATHAADHMSVRAAAQARAQQRNLFLKYFALYPPTSDFLLSCIHHCNKEEMNVILQILTL